MYQLFFSSSFTLKTCLIDGTIWGILMIIVQVILYLRAENMFVRLIPVFILITLIISDAIWYFTAGAWWDLIAALYAIEIGIMAFCELIAWAICNVIGSKRKHKLD